MNNKDDKHCSGFALNFKTHCVEKSLPPHGQNEGDVGQQLVVLRVNLTTFGICIVRKCRERTNNFEN